MCQRQLHLGETDITELKLTRTLVTRFIFFKWGSLTRVGLRVGEIRQVHYVERGLINPVVLLGSWEQAV